MERALSKPPMPEVVFRDALGERRLAVDPNGHETLEILHLRGELAEVPSFEFALRERVSRLANFRHAYYGRVRAIERLNDRESTLTVVSDRVVGIRLSDMLEQSEARGLALDINSALCLIRQLVPAVAMLHESARDVSHGALGPERLIVTPSARLVIVEYVAGAALEQLRYSRERYWKDLQIPLPRTAGLSHFDQRADVAQIGAIALALILGRPLHDDEFPARIPDLVASTWAVSARGGFEPLPPGLRAWLGRALQLEPRNAFASAVEARAEFDAVLGDSEYIASPASLEQFLARYRESTGAAETEAVPAPVVAVPPVVAVVAAAPPPPPVPEPVEVVVPQLAPPVAPAPLLEAPPAKKSERPEIDFNSQFTEPVPHHAPATLPAAANKTAGKPWGKIGAAAAAVVVLACGGFAARSYFTPPPVAVPTLGKLTIATNPAGVAVIVDGEARGASPISVSLEAGAHVVELQLGGQNRSIPVTIAAGKEVSQYIEMPKTGVADPSAKGHLRVRSEPAGAQVIVDGTPRGAAPLTINELAAGEHTVTVTGPLGSVKQTVVVEAGGTASLVVPLGGGAPAAPAGAPVSGWIAVSSPIEVQIFEGGRLIGSSASESIMVASGKHELELVSDALGFRVSRNVQVFPGKTASVSVDLPRGAMSLQASPWAEVWVDGEKVGDTPIGNLPMTIGSHNVVFRHPQLGEQHQTVLVTMKGTARVTADMNKK